MIYPLRMVVKENQLVMEDVFCRLLDVYEGEKLVCSVKGDGVKLYKAREGDADTVTVTDRRIPLPPSLQPLKQGNVELIDAYFSQDCLLLTSGKPRCRRCLTEENLKDYNGEILCQNCAKDMEQRPDLLDTIQKMLESPQLSQPTEDEKMAARLFEYLSNQIKEFESRDKACRSAWKTLESALLRYTPDVAYLLRGCIEVLIAKAGEYLLSCDFSDEEETDKA